MELNTPEERIVVSFCPSDNPDFRDLCNKIRLYVEREVEQAKLDAYNELATKEAHDRANVLNLWDLTRQKRDRVHEIDVRIGLLEAGQKTPRLIR